MQNLPYLYGNWFQNIVTIPPGETLADLSIELIGNCRKGVTMCASVTGSQREPFDPNPSQTLPG